MNPDAWEPEGAELISDERGLTVQSLGGFRPRIWQSVTVDLDETPALGLTVSHIEGVESIEVLYRADSLPRPGYLLESTTTGEFLVPLRGVVGDSGTRTFDLGLGLRNEWGKGSATFSEVQLVGSDEALLGQKPAAPELISPFEGASVTSLALEFRWHRSDHAAAYEVQYAENAELRNPHVARLSTAGGGYYALYIDPIPYLPRVPLGAGKYCWRVRGLNVRDGPGPWSEVRGFTVDAATAPTERELTISPERPLILLDNSPGIDFEQNRILSENAAEALPGNWQSLPDEIKDSNVLLNVCTDTDLEGWCKTCEVAREHGIPLLLQIGTWPGIVDMGRHRSLSLSEAEWLLQHYPVVKAFRLVEQDLVLWGGAGREERLRYVVSLTRLAAKYGRIVIWAELCDHWADLAADAEFMRAISEYKDYFVPAWKATLPRGAHRAQTALLGLWLSGLVSNWGVHADGWWWAYPGFIEHSRKATQQTPASLYGLVWLTGISAGATVYNIENFWNIWDPPGQLTDKMKKVVFPLIRDLASRGLIPDKEAVLQKVRLACRPEGAELKPLFENTYTVRNSYQFIPATGRYYWIPILQGYVSESVIGLFDEVVGPDLLGSPEAIRFLFEQFYPEAPEGDAWAVRVGNRMFAMQSHENQSEEQAFAFELEQPFARLEGTLDSHAYVIARQDVGKLFVHVQRGRTERAKLRVLTTGREAEASSSNLDVSRNALWDPAKSSLEFAIDEPLSASIEITV